MKSELKTITPEFAKELLKRNIANRHVTTANVDRIADDILNGRWHVNGQTVIYNDYRLLDGQHRLLACVKAGIPIKSFVVEGVDNDEFPTIDSGKSRTGSDVLAITGHKYSAAKSTALILIEAYMTGKIISIPSYSNSKIIELSEKYAGLNDSITMCQNTKKIIPTSQLAAFHYLFSKIDKDAADKFVEDLIKGTNLKVDDPVYLLRERLMNNLFSKSKLHRKHIIALVIKAWNGRRRRKPCKRLVWADNESFPVIE